MAPPLIRLPALALLGLALLGLALSAPAEARLPFVPPPPAASAPAPLPDPAPWFAMSGRVPVERALALVGDSPLRGEARVEIRVAAPLPRIGLAVVIDVPDLRVGEAPLGHLKLRAFAPLDGGGVVARGSLEGPAGRIHAEVALPERLSPGPSLIEAAVIPWLSWPAPSPPDPPDDLAGIAAAVEAVPDGVALPEPADALDDLRAAAADWPEAPALRLHFADLDLERLTDVLPDLALGGRATGALALDAAGLRGRVEAVDARWRGGRLGTARGALSVEGGYAELRGRAGDGPTDIRVEGRIPVDFDPRRLTWAWRDADPMAASLVARQLTPAALAALYRFHPAAEFDAGLVVSATGALDDLRITARLDGTLYDGETPRPLVGRLDVGPGRQSATFDLGTAPLLRAEVETAADLIALRRSDAHPEAIPLTAGLVVDVPLSTLMPYLPAAIDDPRGALTGRIEGAGTLGAPRFEGALEVADGQATIVAANARLVDLDLGVRVDGAAARLETLTARSGRGRMQGGGEARWVVTPAGHAGPLWSAWRVDADFTLSLDDMPLVRPGLPAGLLDAEARMTARAEPDRTAVEVDVDTADLRLTGFRLGGARPIARNGAVHRRRMGGLRRAEAWLAGAGALSVTLRLPAGRVAGADTTLDFGGALTVRRQDDDFAVEGGIEARAGVFQLFDNPFALDGGAFSIQDGTLDPRSAVAVAIGAARLADADAPPVAETLDPIIDVRASGRVVETDVRVRIVGPSRRPSLVLESDPPLPEYQILTLLITGRVDAIDERNGEVRRQAARLIDRFHNPSLARQLYDRLGVDKLGLKFGASVTNPILTVGKQINRRLYVETVYHHDAPPDANEKEARVEYRLSPRWTVDTVAGDAGEGSLGLFWQTTFGRPPPPEADRKE